MTLNVNYRYAYDPTEAGMFQRHGNKFKIVTRPFTFWDVKERLLGVRVLEQVRAREGLAVSWAC